ncbi:hypothetical protein HMPREF0208_00789 [Citrobacter koseri]|nr:hypothetical protein HMPREF3220_00034 [Citrobacter koseri]KXA05124.1 hypothetical protein HMPREF3207_00960 [Citrobacter koseri]KXB46282.1 hypothetical protein HMPREF0208_00789 [Citrobacter koseri]
MLRAETVGRISEAPSGIDAISLPDGDAFASSPAYTIRRSHPA